MARRTSTARVLLEAGADARVTDLNGNTALHQVLRSCDAAECSGLIALLVAASADLNARNKAGVTPVGSIAALQFNCTASMLAAARELLAAGADPTIANHAGIAPLDDVRGSIARNIVNPGRVSHRHLDNWVNRVALMRLLHRATAWWRRRHLLLAIRGR